MREIERDIEKTEKTLDGNLHRKAEQAGVTVEQDALPLGKGRGPLGSQLPWMLLFLSITRSGSGSVHAFTAYNCSSWSNIDKSYSLLEPDACAASDGNREIETVVYGEIVQMKQDRIILIF